MSASALPVQPEIGHYYSEGDYAGLFRRFLILAVDLGVASVAGILFTAIGPEDGPSPGVACSWICFCFVYFVILESAIGTLGFLLTGVKIVTLKGQRPSIVRMTFRLLFWILGPINALFDLYWLTGDENKQTLRDKLAGTYVVRRGADPAGSGEIRLNRYQIMSYSFVFYEVKKPT